MKTPKTKLQTPEKFQITNSKAATPRAELGFGDWDFFGVWSWVFGVWISVFGSWCFAQSALRIDAVAVERDGFSD